MCLSTLHIPETSESDALGPPTPPLKAAKGLVNP